MYNHNKAQQSKNRVHISWDILYVHSRQFKSAAMEEQWINTLCNSWNNSCITHWGRVTHICVDDQTITNSDDGVSLGWRQAIICNIAGISLIGPLVTNFREILIIFFQENAFESVVFQMAAILFRPPCVNWHLPCSQHTGTCSHVSGHVHMCPWTGLLYQK